MIVRNLLFYLGIIPVTAVFALLSLLIIWLPYSMRYFLITRWSHFFILWAKITCGLRYQIHGFENLPKTPSIVLSNHQSMWETIFMQVLLPPQTWVLKQQLLSIPFFGWGLKRLKPIAINRTDPRSIHQLLHQGKKRLSTGIWVVLFPEGTRVAAGVHHRFSQSGAYLSQETLCAIVPIAHNAGMFWPKGYWIKKPGTIQWIIGPAISPLNKTREELHHASEHWIRETLERISHE